MTLYAAPHAARARSARAALAAVLLALGVGLAFAGSVAAHDLAAGPPRPDLLSIATAWSFDPFAATAIALSVAAYLWLVRRVDRLHPDHPWPRRRTVYFVAGMVTLALAIMSPIDTLSDDLASVHMVQHALLLMVIPPLLAASGPATLALRASTRSVRDRWLLPALHSRVLAVVTFPVVGWIAFVAVLWGTHYSPIYDLALLDPRVHIAEHVAYLVAACLFWWPIASPDPLRWRMPTPAKILYVLLQLPQMSFLSVTILTASQLLYPAYLNRSPVYGVDALSDQQASGAIMWLIGDMMFIGELLWLIAQWMREEEVATRREDARLDRLALERAAASRRPTLGADDPR